MDKLVFVTLIICTAMLFTREPKEIFIRAEGQQRLKEGTESFIYNLMVMFITLLPKLRQ